MRAISPFAIGFDAGRRMQAERRCRRMTAPDPLALRIARLPALYWEWQKRRGTNAGAVARKIEWFVVRPLRGWLA